MENQTKVMTPIEALNETITILESIALPAGMKAGEAAQIVMPVNAAIGNLQAIIEAIRQAEEQEGQENGGG